MMKEPIINGAGEMLSEEGKNSYDESFITFCEHHPEFDNEECLVEAYEQYKEDKQ